MKKTILVIFLMLLTVSLNSFLIAFHSNLYEIKYDQCVKNLIADKNYQSQEQAFECVKSDISIKILGTILFSDGSILN